MIDPAARPTGSPRRPSGTQWDALLANHNLVPTKSATRTAGLIEDAILAQGWRCGEVLGSLDAIAARYGIGRSVAHEAIRILEIRGACRLRRGPNGGLLIADPEESRVNLAITVSILRSGATVGALLDARRALDAALFLPAALAPAQPQLPTPASQALSARLADHYRDRQRMAEAMGNGALSLFAGSVTNLTLGLLARAARAADEAALAAALDAHDRAVRAPDGAVAAGAIPLAATIDRMALGRFRTQRLDQLVHVEDIAPPHEHAPHAIRIARTITAEILAGRWVQGERIASEMELCDAYGASQMVIRQAVRLLEEHELAGMQPGRGNGLFRSSRQSFLPTIRMVHGFLAARRWKGLDWWAAMRPVQTALLQASAGLVTPEARSAYRPAVAALGQRRSLRRLIDAEMDIIGRLTNGADSAILHLFWLILISYRHRTFLSADPGSRVFCEQFSERCRTILETLAFTDGDWTAGVHEMMSTALQPEFSDWANSSLS